MSNFKSLFIVQLRDMLNINRNSKKEVKKARGLLTGLLIIGLVALLLSACYNFIIFMAFEMTGDLTQYLPLVFFLSSFVILITGIVRAKATLFGNKDYELLESLPLKHSEIIAAKLLVLYLYELIFAIGFFLPAIVVMAIFYFNLTELIFSLFAMFFIPIVPILISGFIGIPVAFLFDKSKYGTILSMIFYIIFIVAVLAFVYLPQSDEAKAAAYGAIAVNANLFYFPSYFFSKGLTGDVLSIALFFVTNIAIIGLFIAFTSLVYHPINDKILRRNVKSEYRSKALKQSSTFKALLAKDFKRVFSSTTILINSLMGGLMSILCLFIFYFSFKEGAGEDFEAIVADAFPFMVVSICFCVGLSPLSSFNLSLEGNSFWIIKSSPIDEKTIVVEKIVQSIITFVPFAIVSGIIACCLMKTDVVGVIAIIVLPILYIIASSMAAMVFQLKFPKLNWKTEQQLVKQSGASGLSCLVCGFLGDMVLAAIIGLIGLYLPYANPNISVENARYLAYGISLAYLVICILVLFILLKKKYRKWFGLIQ